ncbi:MAG: discoidin domain-containing protein [Cyclobacteriaceae bacterium]|nr:discoidin domain-containing protein [Cyclobacteriaceae bacterium]
MKRLIYFFLLVCSVPAFAQTDTLFEHFVNPPAQARPRTWWHWIGSNITKEGITKDLEWMKRAGIGGFQAFDVSLGSGQETSQKILFMSPEWLDAIRYTAAEADRLGLEMTMVTSAGWSETGGTWVKPEEAVKKLVWSEVAVIGGRKVVVSLPSPPRVNGPIRDAARPGGLLQQGPSTDPTFYADYKVLAWLTPKDEQDLAALHPTVTSSQGAIDGAALLDDHLETGVAMPYASSEVSPWVQYEFAKPVQVRSFSFALKLRGSFGSNNIGRGLLQASDDGTNFRTITTLPGAQHDIRALPVRTFTFEPVTAKFWRVTFLPGSGITTVGEFGAPGFFGPTPKNFDLTEVRLFSGARVHRWEDKANFAPMFEYTTLGTPEVPSTSSIPSTGVIDVTSNMNADGVLTWAAPPGQWTIMRMGYSLTGAKNSPAIPAATGFEVDKLSSKHLTTYYNAYTEPLKKALGPLYGKSLQYWLVDSYEADAQNWTEDFASEFKTRRGYDLTPYLPALAGRIVTSAAITDRFLWDFRLTIADLLAEKHYGTLTALAHKEGIRTYSEAAGISLPVIQDALRNKGLVDIPMGEFGMGQGLGETKPWMAVEDFDADHLFRGASDRMAAHFADVREAASAAHIYGKRIVAAESWTGGGFEAPASMKRIGDYWNTHGINRFIFHTSAHQPLDTKPGNRMVGVHINRNITWAEQARPFVDYLSRNSYLLQQGQFAADIAYYLGEDIPAAVPYWEKIQPAPPEGYDYDFLNTEILQQLQVSNGRLVLPSGMEYKVLVLPNTQRMSPAVLNKINALVSQGATVIGPRPVQAQGLTDYPHSDAVVQELSAAMWGDADGKMVYEHAWGKGRIIWGAPLNSVLASLKTGPDVQYTRPHLNTRITWIHRRAGSTDLYFLSNHRRQSEQLRVSFRVTGRVPELWHADTGTREAASYRIENGTTEVALTLSPEESVFVVFAQPATLTEHVLSPLIESPIQELKGPWQVQFPEKSGAPASITLPQLTSWTAVADEGVRFFSGTATYSQSLTLTAEQLRNGHQVLDLGDVRDLAEVRVNGQSAGVQWKAPYRFDVSALLKAGKNQIEILVTNQWTNRMLGDAKAPQGQKVLQSSPGMMDMLFASTGQQPLPSGLLGPVQLMRVAKKH